MFSRAPPGLPVRPRTGARTKLERHEESLEATLEAVDRCRARRRALNAEMARPTVLAHPQTVTAYLSDLAGTLAKAPERAQALLRKHVGTITMTPQAEGPDRHYLATGAFDVSVFVQTSCGGRI
jgi:hypothetical protein